MYNDAYAILEELYTKYGMNKFPNSILFEYDDEYIPAIQWLVDEEYVRGVGFEGGFAQITRTGRDAYQTEYLRRKDQLQQEEQEKANKEAERAADRAYTDQNTKKHFRHNWRIAIFNAVGGFIAGAASEYFIDIIGNAVRLWGLFLEKLHSFFPPS